jgi:phosphoglycolate phosphatase-like HAD superfamily hydrolase
MRKLEMVILDCDGVLANSSEIIFENIGKPLCKRFMSIDLQSEDYEECRSCHRLDLPKKIFKGDLPSLRAAQKNHSSLGHIKRAVEFHAKYNFLLPLATIIGWNMYGKLKDKIEPYEGVVEMIGELQGDKDKPKYNLAVLTSNREENVNPMFHRWGLHNLKVYHCTTFLRIPTLHGKTRGVKTILRKNKYDPGEVGCVVDEVSDVYQLLEAGITNIIATSYGWNNREALVKAGVNPHYIVDHAKDIPAKIHEMEATLC